VDCFHSIVLRKVSASDRNGDRLVLLAGQKIGVIKPHGSRQMFFELLLTAV